MSLTSRRPSAAVAGWAAARIGAPLLRDGVPVPWGTVVPLSVVLAVVGGFWGVTLRGAVGAVERTQQPFASWWRDSLLAIPLATLAVLLAVVTARRLLGPRRRFGFLVTWLLIGGFGTAAGMTQVAISAAYDYVLQTRSNAMMLTPSSGMCSTTDCLDRMQHATLALQVRALGYGAVLILVTNLVVTLWVVAVRGGRLDLAGARSATSRRQLLRHSASEAWDRTGLAPDVRLLLAAALVGAAVIHTAVVPEHLTEWPAAGVFFVVLSIVEVATASALLLGPTRVTRSTQLVVTVLVSGAPLVVWASSRIVGLPFGPAPGEREPVGAPDVVAGLLELGALLMALACLRYGSRLRLLPALTPTSRTARLLAVASLTSVALQTLGLGFGPM
ncbi:hypothetical protein [Lapillicoccus sp.]|uniref:hypothetical protein n=1 Tax=Lapillicoccus sp. TaxID=1909287 RepID=UPI0025F51147|nr:hypothetical protein [Lapillicoccus sp.]